MKKTTRLEDGGLGIAVNNSTGQLCSIDMHGDEYMHPGLTAWLNHEIVMFPVVGPVNDRLVSVAGGSYSLDKHGIARCAPFRVEESEDDIISVVQTYDGGFVDNPKGVQRERLNWLPYTLEKLFGIEKGKVVCELGITNDSSEDMPYMIGWHPAFRASGNPKFGNLGVDCSTPNAGCTLDRLIRTGPMLLKDVIAVTYSSEGDGYGLKVSSDDLDDAMLWSKGQEMVCIEFVSHLPSKGKKQFQGNNNVLKPEQRHSYKIIIEPF